MELEVLIYTIIFILVDIFILICMYEKGSILSFESTIASNYNVIEKYKNKIKYKNKDKESIPDELLPAVRITKNDVTYIYTYYEYLKLQYGMSIANIGLIGYVKRLDFSKRRYMYYEKYKDLPYEPSIFISYEVPYNFERPFYIGAISDVSEIVTDIEEFKDNRIIPKYSNISTIFHTDKEYTEMILNESVQKKISKLAEYIEGYCIEFYENKITLVIKDAKWSNLLTRNFGKKQNSNNVLEVISVSLGLLKDISDEIENLI